MIVSGLVVPPLYLRALTDEQFGLFSFLTLANGLLILIELGFSRALTHEFASVYKEEGRGELPETLRTAEFFFIPMGLLIVLVLFLFADFFAYGWLKAESHDAALVIKLISIVVLFRWLTIFYQAVLLGMEKHVFINAVQIVYILMVSIAGVSVLYVQSWGLVELVWCYLIGSLLLAFCFGWLSWMEIGEYLKAKFSLEKARDLSRTAVKVAGVAIPGIALMQLDKIAAGNILEAGEFGWYMLIAGVASSIAMLITPVYQVAFPRFTRLLIDGEISDFQKLYKLFVQLSASLLFPVAVTLAVFSEALLELYTGDQQLAESMWLVFSILLIAKSFHAIGMIPYAVQLAKKKLRLAFKINMTALVFMIIALPILSSSYGIIGIALSWFLITLGYTTIGMWLVHKYIFDGGYWQWLLRDNISVVCVSFVNALLMYMWLEPKANMQGLVVMVLIGAVSLLLSVLVLPSLREHFVLLLRNIGLNSVNRTK
jgi:O-antigen/teichoic acid export membrane protein